jgi:hypothetical protein
MMDLFRHALGEDRMLGFKFCKPEEEKEESTEPQHIAIKTYREYRDDLRGVKKKDRDVAEDMNPNGFWEDGRFTVRGLAYRRQTKDILRELKQARKSYFAKIVSSGLLRTNPEYVDRVVYMLRHPRAVAKSQERLRRGSYITIEGQEFNIADEVIHTPEMFIRSSIAAARWLVENPDIPLLMVEFDDLIEDPESQMKRLTSFIIEGSFLAATDVVDSKLRRSWPEEIENSLWGEAEAAYKFMQGQEFEQLLEYFNSPMRLIHRENRAWHCVRFDGPTNEKQCRLCKASNEYRASLKQHAEEYDIPWKERPCAFEVAFDLDNPPITIEKSIQNNFWEEQNEAIRQSNSARRILSATSLRSQYGTFSRLRRGAQHRRERRA